MILPVEGGECFPRCGHADGKRTGDRRGIEGMERLSRLEHHEVGDVDHVVDGAETDRFELLA